MTKRDQKNARPSARSKGKPRRNPLPVWRRGTVLLCIAVPVLTAAVGAGGWLMVSGTALDAVSAAHRAVVVTAAEAGLRVGDILVVGRRQTTRKTLLDALDVAPGTPIFAFDAKAARARIEALDWIAEASVERLLPNTVLVNVKEREPLAIWQHKGRYALIDADGAVIRHDRLEPFADLVVVAGADANRHAAALLAMIRTEPALWPRVVAASRVGARRWDIRLRNGIDIRLPETGPAEAWNRLARIDERHRLLDREVTLVDLRQLDRLVVRGANGLESTLGRET